MARSQFIEVADLGIAVETVADEQPSLREARGRAERKPWSTPLSRRAEASARPPSISA
jgi:hypothetical protein